MSRMTRAVKHPRTIWMSVLVTSLLSIPVSAFGQGGEATRQRYLLRERSTGYYEEYEVSPRDQRPLFEVPGLSPNGVFSFSPTAASVRVRARLQDAHRGTRFYGTTRCEECHTAEAENVHTVRGGISCRQCHGSEPISHTAHYYSPLNPIRRHAYLCAKCHEGAGISYASYIIHEPPAGSQEARVSFPLLYYVSWFMLVLLVGTLAFFVPHSFLVGVRELIDRLKRKKETSE